MSNITQNHYTCWDPQSLVRYICPAHVILNLANLSPSPFLEVGGCLWELGLITSR